MSFRAAAWLAWLLCTVSLALVVLGLLLTVIGSSMALTFYWTQWRDQAILLVAIIGAPLLVVRARAGRRSLDVCTDVLYLRHDSGRGITVHS